MKAQEPSGNGSPSVTSHRTSAQVLGSASRFVHAAKGALPQPTFTLNGRAVELSLAFASAYRLFLARFIRSTSARRPTAAKTRSGLRYLASMSVVCVRRVFEPRKHFVPRADDHVRREPDKGPRGPRQAQSTVAYAVEKMMPRLRPPTFQSCGNRQLKIRGGNCLKDPVRVLIP